MGHAYRLFYLASRSVECRARHLQRSGRGTGPFRQYPEQEVLRSDLSVTKLAGLVLSQDQNTLSCSAESLEHQLNRTTQTGQKRSALRRPPLVN
jgi:hypothetical protein